MNLWFELRFSVLPTLEQVVYLFTLFGSYWTLDFASAIYLG